MKKKVIVTVPDPDKTPLWFGKYKGLTPEKVAEEDPQYVVWMFENIKPQPCSLDLYRAAELDVQEEESEGYDPDLNFFGQDDFWRK